MRRTPEERELAGIKFKYVRMKRRCEGCKDDIWCEQIWKYKTVYGTTTYICQACCPRKEQVLNFKKSHRLPKTPIPITELNTKPIEPGNIIQDDYFVKDYISLVRTMQANNQLKYKHLWKVSK